MLLGRPLHTIRPSAKRPFLPVDLPDLVLWLDAKDSDTLTLREDTGSDFASQWDDKSGNAKNATQATASQQPEYVTSSINGLPALVFDGTDDEMSVGDLSVNMGGFFMVFEPANVISAASAAEFAVGAGSSALAVALGASTGNLTNEIISIHGTSPANWRVGWTHASDTITAAPHILVYRWTGSTYEIRLDGEVKTTSTSGTPALLPLDDVVLGDVVSGTTNYDGKIGELGATSSNMTVAEATRIERALSNKWEIAI